MDVDDTHASWEDACKLLKALASGDSLLKRLFKDTYVNEGLWNTRAGNPGIPAFIIGSKDASTSERKKGLQAFGHKYFRKGFDGTISHPEYWHKSYNSKAIIIVSAWIGSAVNSLNWLYQDYRVEYEEAELGHGEIQALNGIVHAAEEFFSKTKVGSFP